jgi:hypothetical protein
MVGVGLVHGNGKKNRTDPFKTAVVLVKNGTARGQGMQGRFNTSTSSRTERPGLVNPTTAGARTRRTVQQQQQQECRQDPSVARLYLLPTRPPGSFF